MTASHRLPKCYAFGIGVQVTGPGIAGEVLTQDGPWTVTVQQDRGRRRVAQQDTTVVQVTATGSSLTCVM